MVAVAKRNPGGFALRLGALDRQRDGALAHHLAHAVAVIHHRGAAGLPDDGDLRPSGDGAATQPLRVDRHADGAVAFHAVQIGFDQAVGGELGVVIGHATGAEDRGDESVSAGAGIALSIALILRTAARGGR